jgi:polar amino acid transport system substrate-binding protein
MTKRSCLVTLCALMFTGLITGAQARTLNAIRADGTLHVLAPTDLYPFTFVAAGANAGFEIELLTTIATDLDLKVDIQHAPSNALFQALQDDKADVAVAALAITSTREQKVDFTQPTLCATMSIISADPSLQVATDLQGKTLGVTSGTLLETYVKHLDFPKTIKVYNNISDMTLALFSKQIDATFGYSIQKSFLEKLYPKYPVMFSPPLFSVPVGMAIAQDNLGLRAALNIELIKLMHDGRYAKLSQKYFGADFRCKHNG